MRGVQPARLPRPLLLSTVPFAFMSHTAALPEEVFCHRMSAIPSPLKSPTLGVQPATVPRPTVLCTVPFPFINHRPTLPELCCHRMSAMPSPLKSPTIGVQPAAFPRPTLLWTVPLALMNHRATFPDEVFCHRMSLVPSPLKSSGVVLTTIVPRMAAPWTAQKYGCLPRTAPVNNTSNVKGVPWMPLSNRLSAVHRDPTQLPLVTE